MNRVAVARQWLTRFAAPTYLEIGVWYGFTFGPMRAARKIAVDPCIKMPRLMRKLYAGRAKETHFMEVPSDDFFAAHGDLVAGSGIDVALVDGLHTYEQTLRDVENALRYLNQGGLIVVHDCNPPIRAMAMRADSMEQVRKKHFWLIAWCGDVWKTIAHLRAARKDVEVCVLDCDCGVGLIRRGTPESTLDCSPEAIARMSYEDLARDRERILNLKPAGYFRSHFLRGD